MIEVYKMGMSKYKDSVDKNSGLFELEIIKKELKSIEYLKISKNVLIILNGVRDSEDEQLFEKIKNADVSIFIMSDSIAIKTSLDIINACDYCLHQAIDYEFPEILCKQGYSGVPELFYKYNKKEYEKQTVGYAKIDSRVIFGGNDLNRQDKFELYHLYDSDNPFITSFKKVYGENNSIDDRIPYTDYIRLLSQRRYSLMICREEYRGNNWITSRFFEALAVDCLPCVDVDYDRDCKLTDEIKVDNIYGLKNYIGLMNNANNYFRALKKYQNKIDKRTCIFSNNIWSICRLGRLEKF